MSSLILKHKNKKKKPCNVIKEAIGKTRCNNQIVYPKKVLLGKETINNSMLIAENFHNFFTEIGPKLASHILQPEYPSSINESKEAFFSLQTNKSPCHDDISFSVIKSCFGSLGKPLLHIFRLSLEERIFPDDLKTALKLPLFLKLVIQMILVTIRQSLFYLVFPKYLRKS